MLRFSGSAVAISLLVVTAGCVTVVPAPGSDQVRLTQKPADVAGCTALGNIKLSQDQLAQGEANFRNLVVGFGGNTALVTQSSYGYDVPLQGIAYRCPSGSTTSTQ